jgi:hypothetical protein
MVKERKECKVHSLFPHLPHARAAGSGVLIPLYKEERNALPLFTAYASLAKISFAKNT